MARQLVFDVNETLLDVGALDPLFEQWFGDRETRKEWFYTLEENWLTSTIIGEFKPFADFAKGALVMVGERRGITVSEADQKKLVEGILSLPAHGDVAEALALLRDHGFGLTALTNSALAAARKQLEAAGLSDYFDQIISVDEVQRYKPAPEPYRLAAERLNIGIGEMTMIAAHAWDITGAQSAGCRTAFVTRPGKVLSPTGAVPDVNGYGLLDVARKLIG